mgnify:CR=1 FL=1
MVRNVIIQKVPYDYTRTVMPTNKDTRPGTPSGTAEPTPPVVPAYYYRGIYGCLSFLSRHRA